MNLDLSKADGIIKILSTLIADYHKICNANVENKTAEIVKEKDNKQLTLDSWLKKGNSKKKKLNDASSSSENVSVTGETSNVTEVLSVTLNNYQQNHLSQIQNDSVALTPSIEQNVNNITNLNVAYPAFTAGSQSNMSSVYILSTQDTSIQGLATQYVYNASDQYIMPCIINAPNSLLTNDYQNNTTNTINLTSAAENDVVSDINFESNYKDLIEYSKPNEEISSTMPVKQFYSTQSLSEFENCTSNTCEDNSYRLNEQTQLDIDNVDLLQNEDFLDIRNEQDNNEENSTNDKNQTNQLCFFTKLQESYLVSELNSNTVIEDKKNSNDLNSCSSKKIDNVDMVDLLNLNVNNLPETQPEDLKNNLNFSSAICENFESDKNVSPDLSCQSSLTKSSANEDIKQDEFNPVIKEKGAKQLRKPRTRSRSQSESFENKKDEKSGQITADINENNLDIKNSYNLRRKKTPESTAPVSKMSQKGKINSPDKQPKKLDVKTDSKLKREDKTNNSKLFEKNHSTVHQDKKSPAKTPTKCSPAKSNLNAKKSPVKTPTKCSPAKSNSNATCSKTKSTKVSNSDKDKIDKKKAKPDENIKVAEKISPRKKNAKQKFNTSVNIDNQCDSETKTQSEANFKPENSINNPSSNLLHCNNNSILLHENKNNLEVINKSLNTCVAHSSRLSLSESSSDEETYACNPIKNVEFAERNEKTIQLSVKNINVQCKEILNSEIIETKVDSIRKKKKKKKFIKKSSVQTEYVESNCGSTLNQNLINTSLTKNETTTTSFDAKHNFQKKKLKGYKFKKQVVTEFETDFIHDLDLSSSDESSLFQNKKWCPRVVLERINVNEEKWRILSHSKKSKSQIESSSETNINNCSSSETNSAFQLVPLNSFDETITKNSSSSSSESIVSDLNTNQQECINITTPSEKMLEVPLIENSPNKNIDNDSVSAILSSENLNSIQFDSSEVKNLQECPEEHSNNSERKIFPKDLPVDTDTLSAWIDFVENRVPPETKEAWGEHLSILKYFPPHENILKLLSDNPDGKYTLMHIPDESLESASQYCLLV